MYLKILKYTDTFSFSNKNRCRCHFKAAKCEDCKGVQGVCKLSLGTVPPRSWAVYPWTPQNPFWPPRSSLVDTPERPLSSSIPLPHSIRKDNNTEIRSSAWNLLNGLHLDEFSSWKIGCIFSRAVTATQFTFCILVHHLFILSWLIVLSGSIENTLKTSWHWG
jgi:hypothetical protein